MNTLLFWLRKRVGHYRSDADIKEELQTHLDMLAEDSPDAPPIEARRRARLRLGRTQTVIEDVRDQEFITMLESWYRDVALGVRTLRKSPAFFLTAVLTLALGIGANTVIFTLLYGLLLRSLPVPAPWRIARVGMVNPAGRDSTPGPMPYQTFVQLRRQQQSFTDISAWSVNEAVMEDKEGSLRAYLAGMVSGNAFELLGIKPHLGRLLSPSDDVRGGPSEGWPALLSYGLWQDQFGGDPQIIGRRIKLSSTTATVVGVLPQVFRGMWPGQDTRLYLPIQFVSVLFPGDPLNTPGRMYVCWAVGRLRPGISLARANAEIATYEKSLLRETTPVPFQRQPLFDKLTLQVVSARTGLPTYQRRVYSQPLYLMQGLVAIALLLCCVNVAGLMMSKLHTRGREFAVRTAIGAGQWRLVRQFLTESFLVALAGATLGGAAAWYGVNLVLGYFRDPMMGGAVSIQPDSTVFAVTGACAVLATLFFGAWPAWRASHMDSGVLLKSHTAVGAKNSLAGRAFVPIQSSLSVVLVCLATLLSQSLVRLRGEATGFDLDHVTIQTARFNLLPQTGDAKLDVYQRMVDRLDQLPGIQAAAVTWFTPMTGFQANSSFEALADDAATPALTLAYNDVGPGYFQTMRTKIIDGREFEKRERERDVCVLNQSAASQLFPHQQAIGRYVRTADTVKFPQTVTCRVIGIAQDAKFASLREPPPPTVYFPVTRETVGGGWGNLVFLINSVTKAQAIAAYRTALAEIAPTIPLVIFATLREQMDAALGSQAVITTLCNFFGGLALFLSALGLYGVLSSSVAQRTAEIGVRIALGARRSVVLRMVLSDALRLFGVGMLGGVLALAVMMRFVRNLLYGVSAFDPLTLVATGAVLTIVAVIAGIIPALRAASIDPIRALRTE
jgi:predicted permease